MKIFKCLVLHAFVLAAILGGLHVHDLNVVNDEIHCLICSTWMQALEGDGNASTTVAKYKTVRAFDIEDRQILPLDIPSGIPARAPPFG